MMSTSVRFSATLTLVGGKRKCAALNTDGVGLTADKRTKLERSGYV